MSALLARLLGFMSPWLWAAVGAGLLLVGGTIGFLHHRVGSLEQQLQAEKTGRLADRAIAAEAAASASASYRAKEQAWAQQQREVINVAIEKTEQAVAAHAAADTAARGLSERFAALARRSTAAACNSAAPAPGAPASSPADLLAFVQRRMAEAAGGIVRFADAASVAGDACVGSYPGPLK